MAVEEPSVAMKLLVDTQKNRVLFAEANKDCVDFLFHVISLPIATVISLLQENEMAGSTQNIYKSIENLHESYILSHHTRDSLLKPNLRACRCPVPILQLPDIAPPEKKLYKCSMSGCSFRAADDPEAACPNCARKMNVPVVYVPPPVATTNESGFVKGVVTYMVMDNLVVTPMSTISCITVLKEFGVGDVSVLQEMNVTLGFKEAVKLLKACLHSNKVLSEVFLPKIEAKVATKVEQVQGCDVDDDVKVK